MLITSFIRVVILRINIYSGFDGIVVVLMRLLCKWKIEQYYYFKQISNDVRAFDWHIYISWTLTHSKGQVKIVAIHSLTANISKMVMDVVHITVAIEYEIAYGVAIIITRYKIGLC